MLAVLQAITLVVYIFIAWRFQYKNVRPPAGGDFRKCLAAELQQLLSC